MEPFSAGSTISINAVTWKQIEQSRPLGKHFRVAVVPESMNPKARGKTARILSFHVFMVNELDGTEDLVIDIVDDHVVPGAVPANTVIDYVAAYSTQAELRIPFSKNASQGPAPEVRIEPYLTPSRVQWTITIDGKTLKGEGRLPRLFTLKEAVQMVSETKAPEMTLLITKPLRKLAKAKDFRMQAVTAALEKLGMKLKRWSQENDLKYETLYKVITRGDNAPNERAAIMKLTGLSEKKLWPDS
ncbi:hypothetical protein [Yoonia sp. SS1-5]|uniref:Uncharacterized protein n=1 Tax=Yoonia rhodophyticola TaxID=3137370 RepID=A0AAN0MD77_9RHOB